jgi:hypothetical protein
LINCCATFAALMDEHQEEKTATLQLLLGMSAVREVDVVE